MNSLSQMKLDFSAINLAELFTASAIVTSLILITAVLVLRRVAVKYVWRDAEVLAKEQRRWIIRIKNISAILIFVGLILIWAPQLHTVALSIAAFAVALVVATREMILCLMGAIMRATTQPFRAGEWISVDGVMGEVIDLDAFSFRLQEVDMRGKSYQFTGRTITIPNSKLFTANIEHANFFKAYIFEDVRMTVQYTDVRPDAAMRVLKEISEKYFAPYRADATAFNRKVRRRAGIEIGSSEPTYDLTTSDVGHYQFFVRFFLPTTVAASVGSEVATDFLTHIHDMRRKNQEDVKAADRIANAANNEAAKKEAAAPTDQGSGVPA